MTRSLHSALYARFRELLVETRRSAGLKQEDVATRLGKPQSYVSKYERGERRLDLPEFLAVARALGADPHALVRRLQEIERETDAGSEPTGAG